MFLELAFISNFGWYHQEVKNLNNTWYIKMSFYLKGIWTVKMSLWRAALLWEVCHCALVCADNASVYCVSTGWLCFQLSPLLSDPFIHSANLPLSLTQFNSGSLMRPSALSPSLSPSFSLFLPGDQLCSSVLGNDFQWRVSTQIHYFLVSIASCGPAASWLKQSKLGHYSKGYKAEFHLSVCST